MSYGLRTTDPKFLTAVSWLFEAFNFGPIDLLTLDMVHSLLVPGVKTINPNTDNRLLITRSFGGGNVYNGKN